MKYNPKINKFNINNSPNQNEVTGFLEIRTTDALTGTPVEDVLIEVLKLEIIGEFAEKAISTLITRYATDENGMIPLIELPLIEWPEERYYANLNVFGYHEVMIINIPIYEDVKTIYNVKLNRITSPEPLREYLRTPTRTEYYTSPLWFF